ncbi:[Pyruvate dehydrogenase [acetyl-transferring]]-phosphatase 1, mitochondrial [Boothiomyces macroporosus]|uniref:[Pyruvate dehydrogenase [acetyl-transferring]]-phosphatase 1, mitochondrial n=1 Tax=Boothiomyces macroporosus TaxID=261099 RepID=A0AAD5UI79_9FUNG|nr:[Pyruvate dehydrogenase [acetyl-transferring]]-phosphatase 1, mitochondrial [Boothiomyces macroporosus]
MLADTELDKILHQNEKSIFVNKHVYRIDFNTIASNNPSEDQSSQHQLGDSYLVGVYDGHGGRECGELVMKHLASYIAHHLSKPRTLPEKEHTIKALEDAFVAIDSDIINGSLPYLTSNDHKSIIKNLQAVRSGCCAVVALINKSDVYVANSGDCRAVLGRKRAYQRNGEPAGYQTIELSEDHTFSNTREYARMLKEHPGEDDTVVVRGRVLGGLMPTRAIGDARYKWPIDIMRVVSPFISRKGRTIIPPNYHSPPYVTAKPDVNHYIFDGNDHFMIIACDGLWDDISSSDAVNHIGELIQKDYKGNFATDLMIKALGQERESVRHILSIPAPQSRRYRDDLTVNVVLLKPSGSDKGAPIEPVPKMPYLYKKQLDYWVQKLETFTKSKL